MKYCIQFWTLLCFATDQTLTVTIACFLSYLLLFPSLFLNHWCFHRTAFEKSAMNFLVSLIYGNSVLQASFNTYQRSANTCWFMFSNSHLLSLTSNKQQTLLHPQLHFSWHRRPLVNLSPAPVLGFLGGWAKKPYHCSGMVIVVALEASINGRSLFAVSFKAELQILLQLHPCPQEKHKHLSIGLTCALPSPPYSPRLLETEHLPS